MIKKVFSKLTISRYAIFYRTLAEFFWMVLYSDGPILNKCVLIAAPHTSNWDFPMMLAYGLN